MFASMGCHVCCAHDADDALKSDFGRINFVFSDVKMPGSMDGVELARKLRREHPSLPIVLASGFLGDPGRLDGLDLEFIRKPYSIETVNAAARAAMARLRETTD
jgi:CheY-like chemotaxis protein